MRYIDTLVEGETIRNNIYVKERDPQRRGMESRMTI